ncbi:MAG: metal-dependent transcriptional regulator [Candidatus Thermoplasmatota archaeon]|jgi:Mn-dependent DtxR family transcriptional regulator|nr:metal-dependent transcriptional regulator [Candidatus Thermoplasmatota archaeon]MCL5790322.1 metal-dependent transcriptional regulator [Candidatus Thermoplasmatota archaeon]
MKTNEDREKYLESIDYFIREQGYARPLEIARHLKVTPASVSQMLTKLSEDGLINYQKYRGMTISEKGNKVIQSLNNKESSIYELLKLIGCDDKMAKEKACFFEHFVDEDLADKIKNFNTRIKESKLEMKMK